MNSTSRIILDRLSAALAAQGVTLKRNQILNVAAAAFGYRNTNSFSAAAAEGVFDPPRAVPLPSQIPGMTLILDPVADARYAVEIKDVRVRADRWTVSPFGNILDITDMSESGAVQSKMEVHVAEISHKHGVNSYTATTAAQLASEIAEYCRDYWNDARAYDESLPETSTDMDDDDVIGAYFEAVPDEYLDRSTSTIVVPETTSRAMGGIDPPSFCIGRVTLDDAEEPILWWSEEDGWGSLSEATVHSAMEGRLPTAGMDGSQVAWYQLPSRAVVEEAPSAGWCATEPTPLEREVVDLLAHSGLHAADGLVFGDPEIQSRAAGGRIERRITLQSVRTFNAGSARTWKRSIGTILSHVGFTVTILRDHAELRLDAWNLKEARSAKDWVMATQDLLTPLGTRERILADFIGEAWHNDNAVAVDDGRHEIDVTYEMLLIGREAASSMGSGDTDALREAVRAPKEVREWAGPFTIHVSEAASGSSLFSND